MSRLKESIVNSEDGHGTIELSSSVWPKYNGKILGETTLGETILGETTLGVFHLGRVRKS
jgi:hypothetical protein